MCSCRGIFLCLLRFYIIDYYVPDFRLYSHWPLYDYTSRDGYSSLWIQICGLITMAPRQMTVLCLLIYDISKSFMKLSDVANIHCYDEADILQSIYRKNYAVYVIRC